jgi:hypothetical protein
VIRPKFRSSGLTLSWFDPPMLRVSSVTYEFREAGCEKKPEIVGPMRAFERPGFMECGDNPADAGSTPVCGREPADSKSAIRQVPNLRYDG